MTVIEKENNQVLDIIKKNDLNEFKNYVKKNKFNLKKINNEQFDLLIYSIENNASFDIINFILNQFNYKNLNYYINDKNLKKNPILQAIQNNNFEIANLLQEHNTSMNYLLTQDFDIIQYLNNKENNNLLNIRNLNYILNHGYDIENLPPNLIYDLIRDNNIRSNKILKTISDHVYQNIVLNFLEYYQNGEALSEEDLEEILIEGRSQLIVEDEMYEEAIQLKNYSALKILFDHDPNDEFLIYHPINDYYLLENAVRSNDVKFVQTILNFDLFSFRSINFKKILLEAKNQNNKEIIKLLIHSSLKNANEEEEDDDDEDENEDENENESKGKFNPQHLNYLINTAIKNDDLWMVKYIMEDKQFQSSININEKDISGEYPVINAFNLSNFTIFKYLVNQGANIHINNNSHLFISMAMDKPNSIEFIRCLLQQNAPMNKEDANGNYPIIKAIKKNSVYIAFLLIKYAKKHYISFDIMDKDGNTPLILSYRLNRVEIFRYMLASLYTSLNINKTDVNGNSLLTYAVLQYDIETIKFLMAVGANPNYKNCYGKSPLDIANSKGCEMMNILLKTPKIPLNEVNQIKVLQLIY
ncbi:ankyrin [Anaeromyces robustus]|uniref:Ankyrin n=1 Tax=Anaeromyces robustus TaxID=1754192 RepID=A0A1Y1XP00_9FUNG|nr:ankyrin [Anaeromyces robustus]|eukprot:ORX87452.1 ankyrin [Anaeromyces robustus]